MVGVLRENNYLRILLWRGVGFFLSLVVFPSVSGGEFRVLARLDFSDRAAGAFLRRRTVPVGGVVLGIGEKFQEVVIVGLGGSCVY